MPGPNRYILLASVSTQTTSILTDLLSRAGVVDPLVTVRTDNEAVATMHQPDREPPLAVFVDLPGLPDATRLIGWIVSSPTTRLIPVFAITGPGAPDSAEVEAYKPTAIIPHPLRKTSRNAWSYRHCCAGRNREAELPLPIRGARRSR